MEKKSTATPLIQHLKYDVKRKTLKIQFTDKNIFCYPGIEPEVYREFELSADKDGYYLKNIRSSAAECFSYF